MAEALAGAQYSQKQEYEADAYGVEFCVKNNIDPYGMYKSLNKLLELSNGAPASSYMQRMFSSHPDTAKRVARAKELAEIQTIKKTQDQKLQKNIFREHLLCNLGICSFVLKPPHFKEYITIPHQLFIKKSLIYSTYLHDVVISCNFTAIII